MDLAEEQRCLGIKNFMDVFVHVHVSRAQQLEWSFLIAPRQVSQ